MRARVGDLAIVRFDPEPEDIKAGRKWNEMVGIVTGTTTYCHGKSREYNFIYWYIKGDGVEIVDGSLMSSRLVRARPVYDDWDGCLSSLTRDMVEIDGDCRVANMRRCNVR